MKKYPYITIDCQIINDKVWNYIISNYNSPLNDQNNTIFISNIQALSQLRQGQLLSLLVDTKAYKKTYYHLLLPDLRLRHTGSLQKFYRLPYLHYHLYAAFSRTCRRYSELFQSVPKLFERGILQTDCGVYTEGSECFNQLSMAG